MSLAIKDARKRITIDDWDRIFPETSPGMVVYKNIERAEVTNHLASSDQFIRRKALDQNNIRIQVAAGVLSAFAGSGAMLTSVCFLTEEASDRGEMFAASQEVNVKTACDSVPFFQKRPSAISAKFESDVVDVGDVVELILKNLGMSMTDLASVLGVQRPTIYAWLRKDALPQQRNLDRLDYLYRVSQTWLDIAGRPLYRYLRHTFGKNGKSLFTLLKSENDNIDEIKQHFEALAKLPTPMKPTSMNEIAALNGLRTKPHPDSAIVRDIESGKRLTNE